MLTRMFFQPRVEHLLNFGVRVEELRALLGVLAVTLHSNVKRFHASPQDGSIVRRLKIYFIYFFMLKKS